MYTKHDPVQNDSNHNEETITLTATQTRELSTEIELNSLAELNKIAVSHKTELSTTNPYKAVHEAAHLENPPLCTY